jgi:hypothetical protein
MVKKQEEQGPGRANYTLDGDPSIRLPSEPWTIHQVLQVSKYRTAVCLLNNLVEFKFLGEWCRSCSEGSYHIYSGQFFQKGRYGTRYRNICIFSTYPMYQHLETIEIIVLI